MDSLVELVNRNASFLAQKFFEQKRHISFKRSLDEFNLHENIKLTELRKLYFPKIAHIKFLRASYFRNYSYFEKHQNIPPEYFINGPHAYYFLSHQWESKNNPDPNGQQFNRFKEYYDRQPKETREIIGYWYDYSCAPQEDQTGCRTKEEDVEFASILKVMHILATLSHSVILFNEGYLDRTWCCTEWILASSISPLLIDNRQIFPFANATKFRHLAILILFLCHDKEMKENLISGEDRYAISFINSLLKTTTASTEATWGDDKQFLNLLLHRHFWYHVRFLGLKNQLAIAFLNLERFDAKFVESIFKQFLFLTADPSLEWTRHALFEIDTMLLENPDPFDEVYFNKHRIKHIP